MILSLIIKRREQCEHEVDVMSSKAESSMSQSSGDHTDPTIKDQSSESLNEYERRMTYWEGILTCINDVNQNRKIGDESLSEIILKQEMHLSLRNKFIRFANSGTVNASRSTRSELKILPTMKLSNLEEKVEYHRQKAADLQVKLQSANWSQDCEVELFRPPTEHKWQIEEYPKSSSSVTEQK